MTPSCPDIGCDLLVIGSGIAGMAASLFAARRGIDTIQVGMTGEINFASGVLDLLGVHPVGSHQPWDNPWEAIERLIRDEPRHPYARIGAATIRQSMEDFIGFLNAAQMPYRFNPSKNTRILTPLGTLKTTYAVPETMAAMEPAWTQKTACLLVDFPGLKGFSARQIKATLQPHWPDLQAVRLPFPGLHGELQTERMARRLETVEARKTLGDALRHRLGDARVVGLPAVLGISRTREVFADLQQSVGVPLFEIPTMLPAVTGVRLRECFERHFPGLGVRVRYQQKVWPSPQWTGREFMVPVGGEAVEAHIRARAVILASGRFFGKGLHADRQAIRETIFHLPVYQPATRANWHRKTLFSAMGHPIHRAGLDVDDQFRPCDEQGRLIFPHLFAAGSILAHQDWIRQKCGCGLAIASAYAAVRACQSVLEMAPVDNTC